MSDRTPLVVGFLLVLVVVVIFVNLDLFVPGYEHSARVRGFLPWQGEETALRGLELREGLDLQGGLQVLLEADMSGADRGDLDQAATTIQNRVDALGVTEPLVQTQGEDKIVVELPGVEDPELAVRTIGETALLEFIYSGTSPLQENSKVTTSWAYTNTLWSDLEEDQQSPFLAPVGAAIGEDAAEGAVDVDDEAGAEDEAAADEGDEAAADEGDEAAADEGDEAAADEGDEAAASVTDEAAADEGDEAAAGDEETLETVYPTVLTGEYLDHASRSIDQVTNEVVVNFTLNSEGGRLLRAFTSDHITEFMPITLDGEVISSPTINAGIGSQGQISGSFNTVSADILVAQLNSGALPVDLDVVGQTRIGPTLGRESVEAALRGGIVGFAVVMLFMLLYYRMPGILADIALMLYVLIVLSLFRLLPVTLTLAGIAGFILSIGMAVDANILIFERMKEELRAGRRVSAAMDIGFSRAWPSIRDSNMSTLITCAILFWFGNQFGASIVKGFAITLAIGVLTSLFTAITVTRTLLHLSNRFVLHEEGRTTALKSSRLRFLFGL
jgi:preprotein translocase subunit SecD